MVCLGAIGIQCLLIVHLFSTGYTTPAQTHASTTSILIAASLLTSLYKQEIDMIGRQAEYIMVALRKGSFCYFTRAMNSATAASASISCSPSAVLLMGLPQ